MQTSRHKVWGSYSYQYCAHVCASVYVCVRVSTADVLEGECRLDQALIKDKRWRNLALLSMSRNRQR